MQWYRILGPRNWGGVPIRTGNNKIDAVYFNVLSSENVSLAASGTMFLAANSGIRLISPSFVQTSGLKANNILAENFGKINKLGETIPLYPGASGSVVFKKTDSDLISSDILKYNDEKEMLIFDKGTPGSPVYIVPSFVSRGETVPSFNQIESFPGIKFSPEETGFPDSEGNSQVINPAKMDISVYVAANSGINLGPNNDLESYKGYILTHDGSGNVAQWKPTVFLRENYDIELPFEGLERVGTSWIRFPKRPALLLGGKLHFYKLKPRWSPTGPYSSIQHIEKELGKGEDTLCLQTVKGEVLVGYAKFAFVEKGASEQVINESFQSLGSRIKDTTIIDPDAEPDEEGKVGTAEARSIDIVPNNPNGLDDQGEGTNVFVFSVTKGAYLPMQLEPKATGYIVLDWEGANQSVAPVNKALKEDIIFSDDGIKLDQKITVPLQFKPNTSNNISTRPDIYTSFNMLGENIDFLIYGKEYTYFNNYDNSKFDLNENYAPKGIVPVFKVDATIPDSIKGSPSGVIFEKFTDRAKVSPVGWEFDYSGRICIKSTDPYVLDSIPSGSKFLSSHADVTISGHTYSTSLIAEDIYLKPIPNRENTEKYKRNALLTVDSLGKIISRVPRINPIVPGSPKNVRGVMNGWSGIGNNQHSIEWDAPDNDGNAKIVNYIIQASLNNGDSWITLPTTTIKILRGQNNNNREFDSQLSATIDNIPVATLFRVAAQNTVGIGPYSEATESLFISNRSLPLLPQKFTATRVFENLESSEITFNWEPVTSWGSSPPSGYIIDESIDGLTWYEIIEISYLENPEYLETGVDVNNYLYRISSINSAGGRSAYNYIYSSGLILEETDLEEEEERKSDELSNFDFNNILFTGICTIGGNNTNETTT